MRSTSAASSAKSSVRSTIWAAPSLCRYALKSRIEGRDVGEFLEPRHLAVGDGEDHHPVRRERPSGRRPGLVVAEHDDLVALRYELARLEDLERHRLGEGLEELADRRRAAALARHGNRRRRPGDRQPG